MARERFAKSGIEQRFLANLRAAGIAPSARLVLAFSGGADSLALAVLCKRVSPLLDLHLQLVHVDHGLRADSHIDAQKCRVLAKRLGLQLTVETLPPDLRSRASGIGVEEAARRERYLALARAAAERNASTILLGHQQNDQAETILLHLFRGSGLHGLSGMRLSESRRIPWWDETQPTAPAFQIVRPLLTESRDSIEAYLGELGYQPLLDDSNSMLDYDRNWVRHQVLPTIEQRWPAVIPTLARSAMLFAEEAHALDQLHQSQPAGSGATLDIYPLSSLPRAFAYRQIRSWLVQLGLSEVGFDVVERIYNLALHGDNLTRIEIGNGISIARADHLLLPLDHLIRLASASIPMTAGGTEWNVDIGTPAAHSIALVTVPEGRVPSVRTLRHGDRWFGTKRNVFEDLRAAGIHPLIRNRVLSVEAAGGILLVPAIYPTIWSNVDGDKCTQVGVRWWKSER